MCGQWFLGHVVSWIKVSASGCHNNGGTRQRTCCSGFCSLPRAGDVDCCLGDGTPAVEGFVSGSGPRSSQAERGGKLSVLNSCGFFKGLSNKLIRVMLRKSKVLEEYERCMILYFNYLFLYRRKSYLQLFRSRQRMHHRFCSQVSAILASLTTSSSYCSSDCRSMWSNFVCV